MGFKITGNSGVDGDVGGTGFRGLIISPKPTEYGALGHYKFSVTTGAMAAGLAGGSEILQFRWADATRFAVVTRVSCDGMFATTAFAAGQILFRMFVARSYTVQANSGTTLTMTGNNQKQRTSMGTSLVTTVNVATTAALTAGTRTLDTQGVGQINTHSSAGVGAATPIIGSIYLPVTDLFTPNVGDGDHPIVLAQNEGFVVQATVPITGVWTIGFTCRWAEVAAY